MSQALFAPYRELFPISRRYTYLNTAAISPLPLPVTQAVEQHLQRMSTEPIEYLLDDLLAVELEMRERAARLIGAARADEVVAVPGTATGINIAARSLPLRAGDNVLTFEGDYPAVTYPWMAQASRGILTKVVPTPSGGVDLDLLCSRIDAHTRAVCVSTAMFATGFRNDMAAIGQICRDRHMYFVVDAIQTLGALPIDVQGWGVDMLAAGSHKWLLCPPGSGLFYCRHELLDDLLPGGAYVGAFSTVDPENYSDVNFTPQPHSGRFATSAWHFTAFVALRAALEMIESAGIERIAAHVLDVARFAGEDLDAHGIRVLSPRNDTNRSALVLFDLPDRAAAHAALLDAGVVISARGSGLRISANFWNTREEVQRVCQVLAG